VNFRFRRSVNFLTDAKRVIADLLGTAAIAVWQGNTALLIKSPAGEFPITIDKFQIEGAQLVIVGRMGVWDARTHVEAGEFLTLLGKLLLSPAVILFALKAPFLAMRGRSAGAAGNGES
jgi:hypothetical protein